MNITKKLLVNTLLISVLFGLLALPIGAIGLANLQNNTVLSAQDENLVSPETYTTEVQEEVYSEEYNVDPNAYESIPFEDLQNAEDATTITEYGEVIDDTGNAQEINGEYIDTGVVYQEEEYYTE